MNEPILCYLMLSFIRFEDPEVLIPSRPGKVEANETDFEYYQQMMVREKQAIIDQAMATIKSKMDIDPLARMMFEAVIQF